jgi:hypothetical protein
VAVGPSVEETTAEDGAGAESTRRIFFFGDGGLGGDGMKRRQGHDAQMAHALFHTSCRNSK